MKNLWKDQRNLAENLKRRLPRICAEYFAAGRIALAPGTSWTDMHSFRLLTKRFRYTLEIFRPAYGPGLAVKIDALKKLQTLLGDINDSIVTSGMLGDVPESAEARIDLATRADSKTAKLRSYWLKEFDAPGEELRWQRYLATYACRRKPLPRTRRIAAPAEES